jgi:hypothetical protein
MEIFNAIGEITDFEIHAVEEMALSVSVELKVHDVYLVFGGPNLFSSIPNFGVDLVGHFIYRCFQVSGANKTRDLGGYLLKVEIRDGEIYGIASLKTGKFFYPTEEFQKLTDGLAEDLS